MLGCIFEEADEIKEKTLPNVQERAMTRVSLHCSMGLSTAPQHLHSLVPLL